MGVGDGIVSIHGTEIARGGGACWLDDDTVLYQRTGSPYVLETYHEPTRVKTVIAAHGANEIAAGGGRWACWGPYGVRTSTGAAWPKAGLLDVSREGILVTCPDRQSGKGADLDWPGGAQTHVPEVVANGVRCLGGVLVWVQAGKVRTSGIAAPATIAAPNYSPVPIKMGRDWWLLYQDGERLLLQPWGLAEGYVVHADPTTYSPDAVVLAANTIRVAWSTTPGEGPTALRVRDINITSPRVRLDRHTPPVEPPPVPTEPNYKPQVQKARDAFAGFPPGNERAFRVINRAAHLINAIEGAVNFGLVSKPSGTNYSGYSIDVLMRRTGESYDCLRDAEGAAVAQWARTEPTGMTDPARWRAPIVDDGGAQPPPVEPPPTEPPSDLESRVVTLERDVKLLQGEVVILHSNLVTLRNQLSALSEATARKFAALRVVGSTGRSLAHSHGIDLKVE